MLSFVTAFVLCNAVNRLNSLQNHLGLAANPSLQAQSVSVDVSQTTRCSSVSSSPPSSFGSSSPSSNVHGEEESFIPSPSGSASSGIVTDIGAYSPRSQGDFKQPVKYAGAASEPPKMLVSKRGMPESSKPLYCLMLVLCVTLIASPLDYLNMNGVEGSHTGGRTLLQLVGVSSESETTFSSAAGYLLQVGSWCTLLTLGEVDYALFDGCGC